MNTGNFPAYFSQSKLIALSKTDTQYPKVNDIRPISIEPFITKLIEKTISNKLKKLDSIIF